MKFIPIDLENWKRTETFTHYLQQKTTFSITKEVEITRLYHYLKQTGCSFYPAFIFLVTKLVNQKENFRISLDAERNVGYWGNLDPLYTIFDRETTQFSAVTTMYSPQFSDFYGDYQKDIKAYSQTGKLFPKQPIPENILNISMVPWTTFSGFNLNVNNAEDYLLPIITGGKFIFSEERVFLPLALQVHHAACDGYHAAEFLTAFEKMAQNPQRYLGRLPIH